ncbi:MAG: AraC family transcriptional regulator [Bacteroidota bacterium]
MIGDNLIDRVRAFANSSGSAEGVSATPLPCLTVLRSHAPTSLKAVLYNPLLCLILQGSKETVVGTHKLYFEAGESLIVSHDVPVFSRIIDASAEKPYLALVISLDMQIVRSLYDEVGEAVLDAAQSRALHVGETEEALVNAASRLFDLVHRPDEAGVLMPLILREIHFRVLLAKHGVMLRQLLRRESHASRLAKVIAHIKTDFAAPYSVSELASIAGMSTSSFHEHFKALTATTPLQYLKNMRLIEARRLLMDKGFTVASAAFQVGYESPTQFSREYARKFGAAPSLDKAV